MQDAPTYMAYLYQALASPAGIIINFDDVSLGRAKLYRARALSQDPDLDILQIRLSPFAPTEQVWIVKGVKKDGQESRDSEGTEARAPDGGSVGGT